VGSFTPPFFLFIRSSAFDVQCSKFVILCPRNTSHEIQATSDEPQETASAKRAGIQKVKSEILKKISLFLTPYFTTTYLLLLYAARRPLHAIFRPNAQVRPFIEDAVFLFSFGVHDSSCFFHKEFCFEHLNFGYSNLFRISCLEVRAFVARLFFDN
jgi:hypothetical protein